MNPALPTSSEHKPLVYACSGCSNVAQLANDLAVVLDRQGLAQMSCIAGVGGHVKPLLKVAQSGRPILAIDGCPLNCVRQTLAQHQLVPTYHLELSSLGYKKKEHEDCSIGEAYRLLHQVQTEILPQLSADATT